MRKYYYDHVEAYCKEKICDLEELRDSAYECELRYHDVDWSAEIIAEDYYDNHDGWEASWPISFRVWDCEGKWLGDYEVSIEYDPTFNATEVTE